MVPVVITRFAFRGAAYTEKKLFICHHGEIIIASVASIVLVRAQSQRIERVDSGTVLRTSRSTYHRTLT